MHEAATVPMTRNARFALLAVAAALLVVGLAGPVGRAVEERERASAAAAFAEQVARENAAIAVDFAANRAKILVEVRVLIDRGETQLAMKRAGRYLSTGDAALRELHREAATAESLRQRGEMYRAHVQRDCTEAEVRKQVAAMLAASVEPGVTVGAALAVTRLAEPEARKIALARVHEPADPDREVTLHQQGAATAPAAGDGKPASAEPIDTPHRHGPATAPVAGQGKPASAETLRNGQVMPGPVDWVTRMREDNRARLLPDYLRTMSLPIAGDVACAWRVDGRREQGSRAFAFTMDVWMAPTPDGKGLAPDPVRYVERPL